MNSAINFLSALDKLFAAAVRTVLVVILLAMVALGALQVFLRDIFASGISWSDAAVRNMVLWVAFLGAILATRKRQHIAIDAVTRFIPRAPRNIVRIFLDAFSCVIALLLARASYMFVLSERTMGSTAFAEVPMWIVQTIIPFGFAVISMEYAIGVCLDVYRLIKPSAEKPSADGGHE